MFEKINLESESQLRDESNPPVSISSVHVSKHFGVDKSLHFKAEYATLSSSKAQRRVSDTIEDLRVILRARFPSPQMTSGWSFMQGWINLQFKYIASLKTLITPASAPYPQPKKQVSHATSPWKKYCIRHDSIHLSEERCCTRTRLILSTNSCMIWDRNIRIRWVLCSFKVIRLQVLQYNCIYLLAHIMT